MEAGRSVSFNDGSGRESTTDLGTVAASVLAVAAPWRVFRWRHGQAHYSGWYWSATTGRHVVYESRLELARLLLADFDPRVVAIAAQPFCGTAEVEGARRRDVPDFLLLDADDAVTVVNVKPADQLDRPKVAAALARTGEEFAERGWRHEEWSGASATVLGNVRFLAAYRYPDQTVLVHTATLLADPSTTILGADTEPTEALGPVLTNLTAARQASVSTSLCKWSGQ